MTAEKSGQELLFEAINKDWSIYAKLVAYEEKDRRRILRSHQEKGFTEKDQVEMDERAALDNALGRLLLLELAVEIGWLRFGLPPAAELFKRLLDSSAFVRYLNTYLYFGVRFLAGRARPATLTTFPRGDKTDINELPVALPTPPAMVLPEGCRVDVQMFLFLSSSLVEADVDVKEALRFLDGFSGKPDEAAEHENEPAQYENEPTHYELWLRGLADGGAREARFAQLTRGLVKFARAKYAFYEQLEDRSRLERWREEGRIRGGWSAKHPLTARFGTNELYWLARLLRLEVSPAGLVSGTKTSWLTLIANGRHRVEDSAEAMAEHEEVLHGVLDYVCDLIQNAVAISVRELDQLETPEAFAPPVRGTEDWRTTFDEELDEIIKQRKERRFDKAVREEAPWPAGAKTVTGGWSSRIRSGAHIGDLIGLALSGGGIRSATFNLGVLQRLQELDLLRHIDYLSTVSGGGYIGAWLLGNVHRTPYWLTPLTDWSASISHLRRFSNYLAPDQGLLSADTWSMWLSWIRNAALIQLTAATWVATLLVAARLVKFVFDAPAFLALSQFPSNVLLVDIVAILTVFVCGSMRRQTSSVHGPAVHSFVVLPVWVGSFLTAAMLWASRAHGSNSADELYSALLQRRWLDWLVPLSGLLASFGAVSWYSIGSTPHEGDAPAADSWRMFVRLLSAAGVAALSLGVVYLGLCGVQWLFAHMLGDYAVWFAYVGGGPLVMFVLGLAIIMIIGLVGPDSPDWRREWWTRLAAWLGIYGVGFLALSLLSVFGPALIMWGLDQWPSIAWGTILGWIATVAGGLFAGNSEKTNGEERESALALAFGWFSRIAAILFIAGALILVATGLHVLLVKIWTDVPVIADYWRSLNAIHARDLGWSFVALLAGGAIMSWRFEINIFGLNQFYRNRLIRCYLGATRWRPGMRKPHPFTGFDNRDDLALWLLRRDGTPPGHTPFRGPFPIVNCALNLGGSSDLSLHTRHSASFVLTPLRCGADRRQVGYARTAHGRDRYADGVFLGQAISVSGAAASPNMGYSTSPLVAVLLTMFNVRLAWWFPNPSRNVRVPFVSLYYLVKELFGIADEKSHFINVSDGGHFENLGIYELVRRRCKVIIACDAECDSSLSFGSLGNVVRICQTDFGARIEIDVKSVERDKDSRLSRNHCAVGRITYANGSRGYLVYLKSSVTGDEDVGIAQYRAAHPAFPHESTGDQFFAEDQFESYRRLGYHIAVQTFRSVESASTNLVTMAGKLADMWVASGAGGEFVTQANAYSELMERLGTEPKLHALFRELILEEPAEGRFKVTNEERSACLELLQLMENAYLALRLDEFWTHPDNRGWVILFSQWARSAKFRRVWKDSHNIYGIRFAYFCHERLGLPIEREAQRS